MPASRGGVNIEYKLEAPGNDSVDVTPQRFSMLRRQVETQLRPVLREQDFTAFDLARAFRFAVEMAKAIESR